MGARLPEMHIAMNPLGSASNEAPSSAAAPQPPSLAPAPVRNPVLAANPRYLLRTLRSAAPLPLVSLSPDRIITIYLPLAYLAEPDRRFPVFYLHDGQNLFDGTTSFVAGRTWRAHTTADRLTSQDCIEPVILVGIANAGNHRMPEYTPDVDPQLGGGLGPIYGQLLIKDLKPLIDREFRTLPDARHTALGGSSLGGLISLFLALEHRDVFGKIAILSPSLWWNGRSILRLARRASPEPELDIWLDIGTAEGAHHVRDADLLFSILAEGGWQAGSNLVYQRLVAGVHNEDAWAERFGEVLAFLFPAPRPPLESLSASRLCEPPNSQ